MVIDQIISIFKNSFRKKGNFFYNFVNKLYYLYRRNNWVLDLRRYWNDFENIEIDRPVFILGFHGSGTTLLSRMIRRHKKFVSVSGNYNYWSGADEMQVVLGSILPQELAGIKQKIPPESGLDSPTGWVYASDDYIDYYRETKEDVSPEVKEKFRKIIRWIIARHAVNKEEARFTDKSQVFTPKVSFINEVLKGAVPKFILLVRNPYALCYRRASWSGGSMKSNNFDSYSERLRVACEHYRNSVKYALKDKEEADLKVIRFEELLSKPREILQELCDFIEVDFEKDMIPQAHHEIPFGSTGRHKWYPLKPEINQKYFEEMSQEDIEFIHSELKEYAQKLGYSKPEL